MTARCCPLLIALGVCWIGEACSERATLGWNPHESGQGGQATDAMVQETGQPAGNPSAPDATDGSHPIMDAGSDDALEDTDARPFIPNDPCQSILLENASPPEAYPIRYEEESDSAEQFEAHRDAFIQEYGITETDYELTPREVTWAPSIRKMPSLQSVILAAQQTDLSSENAGPVAQAFLLRSAQFFHLRDGGVHPTWCSQVVPSYCPTGSCGRSYKQYLAQTYCGLEVASPDFEYSGELEVVLQETNGRVAVMYVTNTAIPMIPVPVQTSWSQDQVRQSLIGHNLAADCPGGVQYTPITAEASMEFADMLTVFVERIPDQNALEYRIAFRIQVTPQNQDSGTAPRTWTVHVDGFDGSLLREREEFFCY